MGVAEYTVVWGVRMEVELVTVGQSWKRKYVRG